MDDEVTAERVLPRARLRAQVAVGEFFSGQKVGGAGA
jgi:hypothetical protein